MGADALRADGFGQPQTLHGLDAGEGNVDLAVVEGVLQHQLRAGERAALALVDRGRPELGFRKMNKNMQYKKK